MDFKRLEMYDKYLSFIQKKIDKFFEAERPFLCCKEGCSLCCQGAQYPLTEIEMFYLMNGFMKLDEAVKSKVRENIDKIKQEQKNFTGEDFTYTCPFLTDNKCCNYAHRPLICRVFGIPYYGINDPKVKFPFCVFKGLNYSKVYDFDQKVISAELCAKSGIEHEPVAYNLSLKFLTDNDAVRDMGLEFGETRNLIDWFDETLH